MIREYPAYARTIAAHLVRGQKPICIAVLLSTRWRYFDNVPKICIKPDDWEPNRYEFSYLRGLHVVVVPGDDCTDEQLGELLLELMKAGPAVLWGYQVDGTKLYDGEDPSDLLHWVCQLVPDREALPYGVVKSAELRMRHALAAANDAWIRESKSIEERSGVEAAIEFYRRSEAIKDLVRRRFESAAADVGEPAAA